VIITIRAFVRDVLLSGISVIIKPVSGVPRGTDVRLLRTDHIVQFCDLCSILKCYLNSTHGRRY
jgi:hypothetical protein